MLGNYIKLYFSKMILFYGSINPYFEWVHAEQSTHVKFLQMYNNVAQKIY